MKRGNFVRNAVVLMATALILRFVGMVFRIYISGRIGAEGMGLYQIIFSLYTLMSTFATSGLTVAVTRLVSDAAGRKESKGLKSALRRALLLGLSMGFAAMAVMYFGADPAAELLLKDPRAALPLRILAPGLPFMAMGAVLRGYFVARRNVSLQSFSQLLEQAVRIGVVVLGMKIVQEGDIEQACIAVVFGSVVSEVVSGLVMLAGYWADGKYRRGGEGKPAFSVMGRLFSVGLPVAATGCARSLLHALENIFVPNRLALYYRSDSRGLAAFGALKGMAMPLLMFPSSFLTTLSMLLVPEVSEAQAAGQKKKVRATVEQAVGITLILSLWIAGIFFLFSRQLGALLYNSEEVGFYLRVLSPIVPFIYLESITEGLLRGVNEQTSSLRYTVVDSGLRLFLIALLAPAFGMYGFLFTMLVSNVFTSGASFRRLLRKTGAKIRWKQHLLLPALCAALSLLVGRLAAVYLLPVLPTLPAMLLSCVVSGGVYALGLFGLGCVEMADILRLLPFLPRFSKKKAPGQSAA